MRISDWSSDVCSSDLVRMLALGAKGVLLGRIWAYALAARGEAGVTHMLSLIEAEMRVAMTLTGATSIAKIDRAILAEYPRGSCRPRARYAPLHSYHITIIDTPQKIGQRNVGEERKDVG